MSRLRSLAMPLIRAGQGLGVDQRRRLDEAHPAESAGEADRTAGRDHGLGRDAVPQVRRAAVDVPFDHGDLGAESSRIRGCLIAGRTATDDHESHGARLRRSAAVVGHLVDAAVDTGEQRHSSEHLLRELPGGPVSPGSHGRVAVVADQRTDGSATAGVGSRVNRYGL